MRYHWAVILNGCPGADRRDEILADGVADSFAAAVAEIEGWRESDEGETERDSRSLTVRYSIVVE